MKVPLLLYLHMPDVLTVCVSTPIRDIITTQKAWSFKPAVEKTCFSPRTGGNSCQPLNGRQPSPQLPPSLRNTMGSKALRKEKAEKVRPLCWTPALRYDAQLLLSHWSAWPGCLHRAGLTIWSFCSLRSKLRCPIRLLPEACLMDYWPLSYLLMKLIYFLSFSLNLLTWHSLN